MEFPISYPWTHGADAFLEEVDGDLSHERAADMCAAALELFQGQYRDKPRFEALTCAAAAGAQDVENAFWQLFTERWVGTAVGGQLDGLGSVLGLPRAGRLDETYRAFLRARVLSLRSTGTTVDIRAVLTAVGISTAGVDAQVDYPAAWILRVRETLPPGVSGADVFELVEPAGPNGVRLTLVAPEAPIENTFRCSDATNYPVAGTGRGLGDVSAPGSHGQLAGVHASSEET
ncbi:MAG: hypothetical protein SangKO_011470 [Sandaracinaceae bacterium]